MANFLDHLFIVLNSNMKKNCNLNIAICLNSEMSSAVLLMKLNVFSDFIFFISASIWDSMKRSWADIFDVGKISSSRSFSCIFSSTFKNSELSSLYSPTPTSFSPRAFVTLITFGVPFLSSFSLDFISSLTLLSISDILLSPWSFTFRSKKNFLNNPFFSLASTSFSSSTISCSENSSIAFAASSATFSLTSSIAVVTSFLISSLYTFLIWTSFFGSCMSSCFFSLYAL